MEPYINGEIRPISVQGKTPPAAINIYGPQKDNRAFISSININSADNFEISLYRYTASTNKKILLYNFSLVSGTAIIDTSSYILIAGDYLYLVVSSGTVNFSIEGSEYQKNCISPPFGSGGVLSIVQPGGSDFTGLTNEQLRAEPVPISGTVTVDSVPLADGAATALKQDEQSLLLTTLNSLIKTNNYLIGLLAPLAGAMNSGVPGLRVAQVTTPPTTPVSGTVAATVANATISTIATFGIPASVIANNQVNLLPALSNISNMQA